MIPDDIEAVCAFSFALLRQNTALEVFKADLVRNAVSSARLRGSDAGSGLGCAAGMERPRRVVGDGTCFRGGEAASLSPGKRGVFQPRKDGEGQGPLLGKMGSF